jgi:hypothetical protein
MRRVAALMTAAALLASGCGGGSDDDGSSIERVRGGKPAGEASDRPAPPSDYGAEIRTRTALRATPDGRVVARLGRRSRWGGPQILAIVERRRDWLGVLHHEMPNGRPGWIRAADARLLREPWSLRIDLSERRGSVSLHKKVVDRFPVGIGRPGNETPTGRFGVTDRLVTKGGSPYGCCILALSGIQPKLPAGWPGGNRIGIHGTPDESSVGSPASAGCVRMRDADLRMLMRRIPVGARVTIVA